MLRILASALVLLCLGSSTWAQAQLQPRAAVTQTASPAKKHPAKAKAAAKPAEPASKGPCGVGVITATQDLFTVQKIGLTIFGNEYAEVPVPWGFDDLIFARARAAAGAIPVRRISYRKGAFDSYYHPQGSLFRNERDELTNLVRQIAGTAGCGRYLMAIRGKGQFDGTNQTLEGVGIVHRGVGIVNYSFLFAYVAVIVFDGQTFEIRKDPQATFEAALQRMAANLTANENMRKIDDSAFPASPAEAANSATLRDGARNLLTERLDKLLPAYFKE